MEGSWQHGPFFRSARIGGNLRRSIPAGTRVYPGSMAAALRASLSRLGALKRFAVSRHSFGAGL